MSDQAVVMGSFEDVDLDRTADALDRLRELGIPETDITIMSSLPHSPEVLGRPHYRTWLPWISLGSAVLGLLVGLFFTAITPYLYIIRVGGQPIVPTPPTLLLLYEFTMLFLIVGTFGGMLWLNHFPSSKPEYYDPKVNDDRISVLVHLPGDKLASAIAVFESHGAMDVHQPERREL
jgi:hypothetical protein